MSKNEYSLDQIVEIFNDLTEMRVDDDLCLEEDFLIEGNEMLINFPAGTEVYVIWHWLESKNEEFAIKNYI